jgi:hypothetical protein
MANSYHRKATEREREISVILYRFYENFAALPEIDGKSDGWTEMIKEAVKIAEQFPECEKTLSGIMEDINRRAKERQNG